MLQNPLPAVLNNGRISYGGSQRLSHSSTIRSSGCGLIAACDLLRYLHLHHSDCCSELFHGLDDNCIDVPNYNRLLDNLRSYFPLIPKLGINGLMLTLGINAFFLRNGYPYAAVWGLGLKGMWSRIENMLDADIPVIISVGPNFPLIWQKYKTNLYVERAGDMRKASSVKAHFMTVTALNDQWMTLSSWGRKYYISRDEYSQYVRRHSGSYASNIVYIKKINVNGVSLK